MNNDGDPLIQASRVACYGGQEHSHLKAIGTQCCDEPESAVPSTFYKEQDRATHGPWHLHFITAYASPSRRPTCTISVRSILLVPNY